MKTSTTVLDTRAPAVAARRHRVTVGAVLSWLGLLAWAGMALLPFYLMVSNSLKTLADVDRDSWGLPTTLHLDNFVTVARDGSIVRGLLNSVGMTGCGLVLLILTGAMAAYPLARRFDRLTRVIYYLFVAGMMVPVAVTILPLYRLMLTLGLLNTRQGLVLYQSAATLPFVIFLYVGFLKAIPRELEESAAIDGAGSWRTFWLIVFPLVRPVTVTVAVIAGMWIWNDFFGPLVLLTSNDLQPLPLAAYNYIGPRNTEWELLFAAVLIASAPLLILFVTLQRYFVTALAGGGTVKG
jgi:raffinose/stachyose/melibiose transport system permease protein